MSGQPDRIKETGRWIEKAENDLLNAQYVMTMEYRCPTDTVCFHCEQCAEKYLKALLVFRDIRFPRTHDLILLRNLVDEASLDACTADFQRLNRYSVEARYPGEWEPIHRDEANEAVNAAVRIRASIRGLLPDEGIPPASDQSVYTVE